MDFPIESLSESTIPTNILTWASPSGTAFGRSSEENLYPPSISQRRNASFAQKHPLLAKLEEVDEDVKHSDYTAHLLIQKQTREYAFAVEDAIVLLKNGTERITDSLAYWRGTSEVDVYENSFLSWVKAASGSQGEEDISRVGREIVTISEAIKIIQDEDVLTFWACEQRQLVWNLLVACSKELVKLRRKLERIKGSLEDRVRNVRRAAILCECEITGNLVPSEIYFQWVNEDSKWCKQFKSNTTLTTQHSAEKQKAKTRLNLFKDAAFKIFTCPVPKEEISDVSDSTESEISLISSVFISPLRTYPKKRFSKKSEVKILHQLSRRIFDEDNSVLNRSLEENDGGFNNQSNSNIPMEEAWSPKPSQKYMDLITANVGPPPKFGTASFVFDNKDARIKEEVSNPNEIYCLNVADVAILNEHQNVSPTSPVANNNNTLGGNEIGIEEGVTTPAVSPLQPSSSTGSSNSKSILNDTMKRQIFVIENTCKSIREIVSQTTWAIRETERMWLSPPENMIKSKKSPQKELYKLLGFIVDTAKLTENPTFSSYIYPEDKHEIVSVLDPVLRELTNCYMSIYVLHNLVVVDTNYLKELVTRFPKGNLVVRDWLNDSSNDVDSEGIQLSPEEFDVNVNVNELFE